MPRDIAPDPYGPEPEIASGRNSFASASFLEGEPARMTRPDDDRSIRMPPLRKPTAAPPATDAGTEDTRSFQAFDEAPRPEPPHSYRLPPEAGDRHRPAPAPGLTGLARVPVGVLVALAVVIGAAGFVLI
jgi:hypothetical protein